MTDFGRTMVASGWATTYVYGGVDFQRVRAYRIGAELGEVGAQGRLPQVRQQLPPREHALTTGATLM